MGCGASSTAKAASSSSSAAVPNNSKDNDELKKTLSSTAPPSAHREIHPPAPSCEEMNKETITGEDGDGNSNSTDKKKTKDIVALKTATATPPTAETTTKEAILGRFAIRYAVMSRRGRDPDHENKPNQDTYSITTGLGGGSNGGSSNECDDAFFGVYDGHGPTGELCAQFARDRLPALLETNIQNSQGNNSVISIDKIQHFLHISHVKCNEELRASTTTDDSFSGTTAISCFLHGKDARITISNVGDSRAVLGTQPKNKMASTNSCIAVPLSNDQTPYRSDEAQRCKNNGARILSFGQIDPKADDDDDVEDPPRVWAKNGRYPGTAFTRSIGDSVAQKLGVYAEPELLTLKISNNEKLIVLATDGVFDVMSNQDVVDLCYQNYKDPLQACSSVLDTSHDEWLKNEDCVDEASASYDDMTITCIFIDRVQDEGTGKMGPTPLEAPADISTTGNAVVPAPPPASQQQQHDHHRKRVRQKTLRNLDEMEEGVEGNTASK